MEDFKGTKGEWKVTEQSDSFRNVKMLTIHLGETPTDYQIDNGDWIDPTICGIWLTDEDRIEECRANAQLMAAAPDLMSALRAVIMKFDGIGGYESHPLMLNAKAAIDKAIGNKT